jgi:ankyrin repeat protein
MAARRASLRVKVARGSSAAAQRALTAACRDGDENALRAALRAGAEPDRVVRGWAPLHALVQETVHGEGEDDEARRAKCVRALIEARADLEVRAGFPPATALVLAGLGGKERLAQMLIDGGAKVDVFAEAALLRLAAVKKRLARDATLATAADATTEASSGLTLLHFACGSRLVRLDAKRARDGLALVRLLIDAGADVDRVATVNVLGETHLRPSYFAIGARRFAEAQLLLERGADANAALVTALWNTKDDFARFGELCLAHGARHDGRPLLNELVRWGQFKTATWLLEHGASTDVADERGWTALHQAASRGNRNFWETIVASGADLTRPDVEGRTPLSIAKAKGLAPANARSSSAPMAAKPTRARRPTK